MKNSYIVNIWEFEGKINIKLEKAFLLLINKKISEKYKNKKKIYKKLLKYTNCPFSTFCVKLKKAHKSFIDLEIILSLCKILNISNKQLQKNIIAYKSRKGKNMIINPKLPIKITPVFDMLIAHHIGDGTVINGKNRTPYFGYRQFNKKYRFLYLKKIESVFGNVIYKKDYIQNDKTTKIYSPVTCSEWFFKIYNLNTNSFKSETARIPIALFNKNWKHKLAFLIGIIIDEGHIDSDLIIIRLKNKELITDLHNLCNDLNYISTIKPGKEGIFCLYILSKRLGKFYADYCNLLKEYPEIDLGFKGDKIKQFIKRQNKPKRYIKGNKEKILYELKNTNLTVNELSEKLKMTRQGARYLVNKLIKENLVEIKSITKFANNQYGLK